MTDSDSLWLQKSINLSDPLDTSVDSGRGSNVSKGSMNPAELEAIANRPMSRLSDGFRQARAGSSARLSSLASAMGGFNMFEVDELKGKLAQLNREKLRWEDANRDLERTKAELRQARDDYRTLESYTESIKTSADESSKRAERDVKSRQEAEAKLLEAMRTSSRDQQSLKTHMDELRKTHAHAMFAQKEALEAEKTRECERIVQDHEAVVQEYMSRISAFEKAITTLEAAAAAADTNLARTKEELGRRENELMDRVRQLQDQLNTTRADASQAAKDGQHRIEVLKSEHAEAMEQVKAITAEQLHVVRAEAKSALTTAQERIADVSDKLERTQQELFSMRSELQASQSSAKEQRTALEFQLQHNKEIHLQEMQHLRSDIRTLELNVTETQKSLTDALDEQRSTYARLTSEQASTRAALEKASTLGLEVAQLEERLRIATADIETRDVELDDLAEVMQRMVAEKDGIIAGYTDDIADMRSRCEQLESDLTSARQSLSNERKAHLATDGSYRRNIAELHQQLSDATSKTVSAHTEDFESQQHLRTVCEELEQKLAAAEMSNRTLAIELETARNTARVQTESVKRPRGLAEVSQNTVPSVRASPVKKQARREPAERIFAVSGFEGQVLSSIKRSIEALPYASLVECRSNAALPSNVTHLVASGQLTVKLLSAAVKGCWIVPHTYVEESFAAGEWDDESHTGFKHNVRPLMGKGVYFSVAFKASKHFATARLLVEQGGAVMASSADSADIVLATTSEAASEPSCRTWEAFVNEVYPVPAVSA